MAGRAEPSLLSSSKKSQKGFQQGHNRSAPRSEKTLSGHELVLSAAVYHPSSGLPCPPAPSLLLRRTHTPDARSGPLPPELPLHRAARKHQRGTRSTVRRSNTRAPPSEVPEASPGFSQPTCASVTSGNLSCHAGFVQPPSHCQETGQGNAFY